MADRKRELYGRWDSLKQIARELAKYVPARVADKLIFNTELEWSRRDFDTDFDWDHCRLDYEDIAQFPEATNLIEDLRQTRQDIYNFHSAEEQAGPHNKMTC